MVPRNVREAKVVSEVGVTPVQGSTAPVVRIEGEDIQIVEYQGKRVVTFADIDRVHVRPDGTAGRNFRENRDKLVEGKHYFIVGWDEIRRIGITSIPEANRSSVILITEKGYMKLVKSFTDPLAWQVQDSLVDHYFDKPTRTLGDYSRKELALMIVEAEEKSEVLALERDKAQGDAQLQRNYRAVAAPIVKLGKVKIKEEYKLFDTWCAENGLEPKEVKGFLRDRDILTTYNRPTKKGKDYFHALHTPELDDGGQKIKSRYTLYIAKAGEDALDKHFRAGSLASMHIGVTDQVFAYEDSANWKIDTVENNGEIIVYAVRFKGEGRKSRRKLYRGNRKIAAEQVSQLWYALNPLAKTVDFFGTAA